MKTRLPFLLLSALLLVALLAACGGGGNSGPVPADAVAQVDGTPVSKTSFTALMDVACARYKAQGQACPKVGTPTYSSLRDSAVTFLVQQEELAVAADERRVEAPCPAGRLGNDVQQPHRADRLRLALQLERPGVLGDDRRADELVGRLADQDLARPRGLLEPGGDVHRVAGDERRYALRGTIEPAQDGGHPVLYLGAVDSAPWSRF